MGAGIYDRLFWRGEFSGGVRLDEFIWADLELEKDWEKDVDGERNLEKRKSTIPQIHYKQLIP